jgi:hypothetical protein
MDSSFGMRKLDKIIVSILSVILVPAFLVGGIYLFGFLRASQYYGQAERIQPIVWILAEEMKDFSRENGRNPQDLSEIAEFSTAHDFRSILDFPHRFEETPEHVFFIRINRMFGFSIDGDFEPKWVTPDR